MKKLKIILFIILTFVITCFVKPTNIINAKMQNDVSQLLIVRLNSNVNDVLKNDDFIVISNNVNTAQVGTYFVTYKNIQTNEIVEKKVIVIDDDSYAYADEVKQMDDNYEYHFVEAQNANREHTYLYHFKYPYFYGENYMIYVNDYETKLVVRAFRGEIIHYQFINNHYLGCGYENNVKNDDPDMFLFSMDDNNKALISVESDGVDQALCVSENDIYYFLAGYTESSDGLFSTPRQGRDSACVVIDKSTKEVVHAFTLGLTNTDYFSDIIYHEGYLYFIQIEDEKNFRIIKTDIFGNKEREYIVYAKYGYANPKLRLWNNEFYLSYSSYDYDVLDYVDEIKKVSLNLELSDYFKEYNKGYELNNYEINGDNLIVMYKPKKTPNGFLYKEYLNNEAIITYYSNVDKKLLTSDRDYVYLIGNEEIFTYQINTLFVKNRINNIYDLNYNKPDDLKKMEVYLNGINKPFINNIDGEINLNLFGTYQINYLFQDQFTYLETVEVNVLPHAGIYNNGIFDKGIIIDGNFKELRINNELVNAPYEILDTGSYKIEITGLNNQVETYQIQVDNLSTPYKHNDEVITLETDQSNENSKDVSISLSKRINNEKQQKTYYFMYIIPLVTVIIGFILTRRGVK